MKNTFSIENCATNPTMLQYRMLHYTAWEFEAWCKQCLKVRIRSSAIRHVEMMSLELRLWHEFVIESWISYIIWSHYKDLMLLPFISACSRWTWIHMLIHPFMHGARIKAKRNRCSVDMGHRGRRHHEFESVLWPLWMLALDCYSIPSLTTSKCLIKLKWLKNNGDKYLRIAVLHGPMALRRLTTSQLAKTSGSTPLPRCLLCLQAAPGAGVLHISGTKPQVS